MLCFMKYIFYIIHVKINSWHPVLKFCILKPWTFAIVGLRTSQFLLQFDGEKPKFFISFFWLIKHFIMNLLYSESGLRM